jgi:Fic family protein
MGKLVEGTWEGHEGGYTRRDRLSCQFSAYLPDLLMGRPVTLAGSTAADAADAELALAHLDRQASGLANTEALARLLLRAEAVSSSKIEGLQVGARRLLRAEVAHELAEVPLDVTANEVLNNIAAMRSAVEPAASSPAITKETLCVCHRLLMSNTPLAPGSGRYRTEQNWIGGSSFNPSQAAYVPPPPEHVEKLMADLIAFCNDDALPALTQAALAHAQFEIIHPFVDGNGRLGRLLIYLILRRRKLIDRVLPPISLVLATRSNDYIRGLRGMQYTESPAGKSAMTGLNDWISIFSAACLRAAQDVGHFEKQLQQLHHTWRDCLGKTRSGSTLDRLLHALPGAPVLTVQTAASLVGRGFAPTNEAIARLLDAGILKQVSLGRRNRIFEAPAVIEIFHALERRLASPSGDTRQSPPVRPVPHKKVPGLSET